MLYEVETHVRLLQGWMKSKLADGDRAVSADGLDGPGGPPMDLLGRHRA